MTKQVIEIDVTWSDYNKLRLNALIAFLSDISGLGIERLSVREIKKR